MLKDYKRDLQISQKCKNIDDPIDTYFAEPLGMVFAKLFIKLKLVPNAITFISMIFGVVGGVCLLFKTLWLNVLGIVLIILASVFDCSDGQVARLTNHRSALGRMLDGLADTMVYISIYVCLSFRLMDEFIPFTETKWSFWIWFISFPVGIYFHTYQARVADYFRNVHLYFVKAANGHDLSRSYSLRDKIADSSGFMKFANKSYYSYTLSQERITPNLQKLLNRIDDNDKVIPENVRQFFYDKTHNLVKLTPLLTFNPRTYVMFALVLLSFISGLSGIEVFTFAFVLFILEPIKIALLLKYESIAKKCLLIESENTAVKKSA